MPTFGSLFSGIGGIDLGLERAGWTCRWQVDSDAFCRRVLERHWPDIPRYGDIRAIDWGTVEPVDLLAGGFPCQPVSLAGKGLAQADERWLWPEFARAIRALRPRLVLVENVPGLLVRGMGDVLGDLAAAGFDAEWFVLSAADVGAPHLRRRVWIVAHADEVGRRTREPHVHAGEPDALRDGPDVPHPLSAVLRNESGWRDGPGRSDAPIAGNDGAPEPLADAEVTGLEGPVPARDTRADGRPPEHGPGGRHGGWWATEPDVGRVAHGVPSRVDRLRSLGNAVVPQCAEVIGRWMIDRRNDDG